MKLIEALRSQNFSADAIGQVPKNQIDNLIDKSDAVYYRVGSSNSILTDAEYDALKQFLKDTDPNNERITRVGIKYTAEELRSKVQHNIPMGSLDNTDDGILGVSDWYESMQATIGVVPVVFASLKIDGGSICATYKQGKLVRVATRGNGEIGDDITANGASFADLPLCLPEPLDIDVRGEAVLFKQDFIEICDRDNVPEADRSNPRNVGNGIFGRDDGKDSDRVHFMVFNAELSLEFTTLKKKMDYLKELGFKVVPHKLCSNLQQFNAFYNQVVNQRDQLPFEIDGIVIAVDDLSHQRKFITKDIKSRLRPKYARAVKFPHKSNVTTLESLLLSVGHTRVIIPTAVLKEVRIGGVNVSRALLNNWDEIKRLGIAIGDEVEVVLAGDIIPKIIRKVKDGANRQLIQEPERCPSCGEYATREYRGKKGANTYCSNVECSVAKLGKIDHWIGSSKKGVGILGIGDTILQALWDNDLISDPADLYRLTVDMIKDLKLDGDVRIGESRATQIIANIAGKKQVSLSVFLGSLGIDLLGRRRVTILAEASEGQLVKLEHWLNKELMSTIKIPGFGDTIREAIIEGIDENRQLIQKLLDVGVVVEDIPFGNPFVPEMDLEVSSEEIKPKEKDPAKPFAGYSFCLTGTRAHQDDIVRLGGTLKSGVSKGLTFLVQADALSVSKKTQKAEEYGTSIISIDYLRQAVEGLVVLEPTNLEPVGE